MALKYLADTSVLSRLNRAPVRKVVSDLVAGRHLARCGRSDLELGFSAGNVEEWDDVQRAAGVFALVHVENADVLRARGVQRALAAEGLKGWKVPDLLIAATAERHSLTVLHYDRDFELIAGVTGQAAEWVVERGAID